MNIGDIAEMAGVSRAAVSRYLNNGYISAEKSEKIRRVIEETGYQPSAMARTLRTKKTRLIGVILPRINSDTISSIVAGIGSVLGQTGYEMLLGMTDNIPEKELEFLKVFSSERVDGVILIATVFIPEYNKLLKNRSVPVVIVGQRFPGCSSVYHNDYGAGRAIAEYVLQRGRRNVGYIGVTRDDIAVGQERMNGVLHTFAVSGSPIPEEKIRIADFSTESGYQAMLDLEKNNPDLDAVICATDNIALGVMNRLRERGLVIPRDVGVTGFGDNRIAEVMSPGLTTIHFHYEESGAEAARWLVGRLEGECRETIDIRLGFELVRRGSV